MREFIIEYWPVSKDKVFAKSYAKVTSTDPESACIALGHDQSSCRYAWTTLVCYCEGWTVITNLIIKKQS